MVLYVDWSSGWSYLSSVQSLSRVRLFATPWTAARRASLSITNSWSVIKLMSIELVMPSNHPSSVVPFSLCLQSFPASGSFPVSWLFTSDGQSIQLQHPSNEYSGLISFRINWFDLFAVQGTLQGLSKVFSSTTVQKHQFFGAQPSSWSNSCIHTWLLEKPQLWLYTTLLAKRCFCFLIHCLCLS